MASATYNERQFLFEITNDTLTIRDDNGIHLANISVPSSSTSNASVEGYTGTIDGKTTNAYTVEPTDSVTFGSGENTIDYLKFTSPDSNCTMRIILTQYR